MKVIRYANSSIANESTRKVGRKKEEKKKKKKEKEKKKLHTVTSLSESQV